MSPLLVLPDAFHPLLIKYLDTEYLLHQFGGSLVWVGLAILFVECGLFFPFLPGDTLLVAVALFIARGDIHPLGIRPHLLGLAFVLVIFTVAAFAGNVVGYEIGRKLGPPLYAHDGKILKRKYLDNTQSFFDRNGNKALVIGRFVPFVRTYITLVAGITAMERRKFITWSAVGAALWVIAISLIGYFLGQIAIIRDNIDYAMIALAATTLIPVVYEAYKHKHDGPHGHTEHGHPEHGHPEHGHTEGEASSADRTGGTPANATDATPAESQPAVD